MLNIELRLALVSLASLMVVGGGYLWADAKLGTVTYVNESTAATESATSSENGEVATPLWPALLDTADYDKRILALANYVRPLVARSTTSDEVGLALPGSMDGVPHASSGLEYSSSSNVTVAGKRWPAEAPYPSGGAVLPFKRILAYYGNFYSRQMGILGELEPDAVIARLAKAQAEWEKADPETPVLPAIEYIAMVAQADAGRDGMYRAVMPDEEIEKAYALAQKIDGVLILDIQAGLSTLKAELPKFKKYLERPDVFFAIDPEFSMKGGQKPGTVIGTYDATDVNYVIDYLAAIVKEHKLPPKVLLVHRFTNNMVTRVTSITPRPEVQVVMVMDGWGPKQLKYGTYAQVIEPEPVQFAGIKIFYKNDLKPPSTGLLTPAEVLDLHPKPIYVQYQ